MGRSPGYEGPPSPDGTGCSALPGSSQVDCQHGMPVFSKLGRSSLCSRGRLGDLWSLYQAACTGQAAFPTHRADRLVRPTGLEIQVQERLWGRQTAVVGSPQRKEALASRKGGTAAGPESGFPNLTETTFAERHPTKSPGSPTRQGPLHYLRCPSFQYH